MSSTLIWEPEVREQKSLSTPVKWALQKRNCGIIDSMRLDTDDLDYVKGLIDAGVEGAQELYDAISNNHSIVLKERF